MSDQHVENDVRRKAKVPILVTELTQRDERFDRQVPILRRVDFGQEMLDGERESSFRLGVISAKKEALSMRLRRSNLSPTTNATAMMQCSPNARVESRGAPAECACRDPIIHPSSRGCGSPRRRRSGRRFRMPLQFACRA